MRLAFLISGTGRTLQNFIDKSAGDIVLVISSKAGVVGLERAKKAGIPTAVVNPKDHDGIIRELDKVQPDLVLLAGYLHLFKFPKRYYGKVLNIHPALLPKYGGKGFYGHHVHEAVLRAGEKESGCTVHFADLEYDHGPIVLQKKVPVLPGDTPDTLAERVFQAECEAYPEAVRLLEQGKVKPPAER